MARLLHGKALADQIAASLSERVPRLAAGGPSPALATVALRPDPTALLYVERLRRVGERLGVRVEGHEAADAPALYALIDRLNADRSIHGIAVLTPLPGELRIAAVAEHLDPKKDVEGLHPYNAGRLATGDPTFIPSTAEAVLLLLRDSGVRLAGARAVVVGRSPVVGRPTALLLMSENATVTLAHSGTHLLGEHTRQADILVVAAGRPGIITGEMVKPGAVVADTGINSTPDGVVGDVDFPSVSAVASAITPVPGGVGSLTTVLLLRNVIRAAEIAGR